VPPAPLGTSNKMSAPYQAVKARDGYFVMGATNQKLWARLCALIERPDLLEHPDYATVALRLKHREALIGELEAEFVGDAYGGGEVRQIPPTLREAIKTLEGSDMLREAFGNDVIEHYLHAARWEQSEFDRQVTDWEVARGFERS